MLVENREEGNRKIVDGVIRVGSVAPRAPRRTPSRKEQTRGRQSRNANNALFIRHSTDILYRHARISLPFPKGLTV